MNLHKRLLCVILCISMILSLVGCGQAESTPTQTTGVLTEETQVAVDSYLAIAQGFIDQEDFDSAIAVLEQAKGIAADGRIDEMLAQIEERRSTPLEVVVNTEDDFLKSGSVEIHSVTASERHNGFVRYTVDYTASAGMSVRMEGGRLQYECDFITQGGRDIFEFEIEAAAVKAMKSDLLIVFQYGMENRFHLRIVTKWPGENQGGAITVPFTMEEDPELKGCEIHSLTVQAADKNTLIYTIDCTRASSNNVMDLTISAVDGEPLYIDNISTDHWMYNLTVNRAAVEAAGDLCLRFEDVATGKICTVTLPSSEYELPKVDSIEPIGAEQEVGFAVYNKLNKGSFEISSCRVQILNTGFARFTIEYSAEENIELWVNCYVNNVNKNIFGDRMPAPKGQTQFFISMEDLHNSKQVGFTLYPENNGYYEITIPNTWANYVSEGEPIEEPIEIPFEVLRSKNEDIYSLEKVTMQHLNNGLIRLAFDYHSAAHASWELSAIDTAFVVNIVSGPQAGPQTLILDVDPEEINGNYGLCLFCVENWVDVQIETRIDINDVLESSYVPEIVVNVLRPVKEVVAESGIDELAAQLEMEANKLTNTPVIDVEAALAVDTSTIQPLEVSQKLVTPKAQDGIQPYEEYYSQIMPENADISDNPALAYSLTFSDKTEFSANMPASYDPNALLEWGKDPGLNVDVLHELGYTGKGAVIAYVDQPIHDHAAYANVNLHNTNNTNAAISMHGPAVLSLLAGKEIGTAPEAEVWYYSSASWEMDHSLSAACLYQIIEQNKSLPDGEKITMVGFSDNIVSGKKNEQALIDAVKACEEAGIMVWFCGEYVPAAFLPLRDKNNFDNVIRDGVYGNSTPELVHVPAGSRTSATGEGGEYIYWASGGYSWTMPYVLGIYAIVNEIDPSLTQDDLRKMIVETAYVKDGMKIINPVEFVAAALEGVGKTEDAAVLRNAAKDNARYTYAIMNKKAMTAEDIAAAESYLKEISDSQVLVVDACDMDTAQELYTVLQADSIQRGGKIVGIQIFGNADLIPAFEVGYKVQMDSGVDSMGTLLTDLFYGNFNNAAADIGKTYNVMDHFENGWKVQLVPEWKVARLPLAKGEFATFFDKYMDFAETAGLGQQTLVSFSNPIFATSNHTDDMGYFLNRLCKEFGIDLGEYRLYGNQLGQYPVTTDVLGGFTADNLSMENGQDVCEFIISTHGQKTNVDKCWFENGQEKRESLMNMDTINEILGENPYYLNLWTCNNGEAMKDNLTTAALNGKAVGVFSVTHIISNNGVNNQASLQTMTQSNFCYFYLHYLKALSEGVSRSDAFFAAQQAYGNALAVDSQNGIRVEGNYQFNLYNLLGYHNFGVLEPNDAFSCINSSIS